MLSPWIPLLIFILIFIWILIWISMKKRTNIIYVESKPYLHSPEYRYPTKCFDCIRQESQKHWNRSYGYGLVSY